MTLRCAVALSLFACLTLVNTQAQTPSSVITARESVITDSKGRPKAIHVEVEVHSDAVVDRATIFYRRIGKTEYFGLKLSLNRELVYEGNLPYLEKLEYYVAVETERRAALTLGLRANPLLLNSEDLPRIAEAKRSRLKRAAIGGAAVVSVVVFAIMGMEMGRNNPPKKTGK